MEGSKGGSRGYNLYFTSKKSLQARWDEYLVACKSRQLPVQGSFSLFKEVWRQHNEIHQTTAKGHPVCDECGLIKAERVKWEGRTDPAARLALAALKERKAAHDADHRGERNYAWDFRQQGGES